MTEVVARVGWGNTLRPMYQDSELASDCVLGFWLSLQRAISRCTADWSGSCTKVLGSCVLALNVLVCSAREQ